MSIGDALAQAREQAGMTVTQVSERTRIRARIIGDIEHDDFSSSLGDFYARSNIRDIARVVGIDPGPLIEDFDGEHKPAEMPELDPATPPETIATQHGGSSDNDMTAPTARHPASPPSLMRARGLTIALCLVLLVAAGVLAFRLTGSPRHGTRAGAGHAASPAHSTARRSRTHRPSRGHQQAGAAPAVSPAVPVKPLTPVSVTAFGPAGTSQGDNPDQADGATSTDPALAWQTDWYTTPEFGGLESGTGLLLNMGQPVTVTAVQLTLGAVPGTDLQLRAGNGPALSDFRIVTRASDLAGSVWLQIARPRRCQYLLVWLTRLPPDQSGTFRAAISGLRLRGTR